MPAKRKASSTPVDAASGAAKRAILAAARHEFSIKGAAGARVNEIAERSGVNKQLIYYYFGSKDQLYAAALEAVYAEIRELEQSLHLDDTSPDEAMRTLVTFSFDYLATHPEFIGMLNHENAVGGNHVQRSETIKGMNLPLITLIRKTLARGVDAKLFRSGIDPLNLYISIAGMSYFFFSNRQTLSSIFGRDLLSDRTVAAYRKHVLTFAMAAVKAD
jgi:TetR/AcrR family transcriptional regulator